MTTGINIESLFASHNLVGITLKNGWEVTKKLEKGKDDTGGNFSICYLAEKDGKEYFVKVINFLDVFASVDATKRRTDEFIFERDLSNYCRGRRVKNVAVMLDAQEETIDGFPIGNIAYLVFEKANSDVRKFLEFTSRQDVAWSFKSLKEVALGLDELHKIGVSHLDVKPSNVLIYESKYEKLSKISDLGRSICSAFSGPFDGLFFSGDKTYAPLDVLYKYEWTKDANIRRYTTDVYMLGNLVVFYLTKTTMTSLMLSNLPDSISPYKAMVDYESISADVENAFQHSLKTIELSLPSVIQSKDRVIRIIEYLCNPHPGKRGHPKNVSSISSNYGLARFVTSFDLLKRETELEMFKRMLSR